MVLELQLSLLQAAQLQLVMPRVLGQQVNDRVEVSMLHFEFDDSALYVFRWDHGGFAELDEAIVEGKRRRAQISIAHLSKRSKPVATWHYF